MRLSLPVVQPVAPPANGVIIYRGPSKLGEQPGLPIVAVAVGLKSGSTNAKTGELVQVHILVDLAMSPLTAVKWGTDAAICGTCIHRKHDGGAGTCYVNTGQGPRSVWDGVRRGIYPAVSPKEAQRLLAGRNVRLGAYGDPAAVPLEVWREVLKKASGWTGYTHQWRQNRFRGLKQFCMASCDTPSDRLEAQRRGWRTFRVRLDDSEALMPGEFECPASAEQGKRLTCEQCLACCGGDARRASPAIILHAAPWLLPSMRQRLSHAIAQREGGAQ